MTFLHHWHTYIGASMQNSTKPVSTPSHNATLTVHYEDSRLFPLWRAWLDVAGTVPLDKWIKTSVRQFAHSGPTSRPEHDEVKKHNKFKPTKTLADYANAEATDAASLSLAMFSALRFQQLASGLEFAYRASLQDPDLTMNWMEWDSSWQVRDLQQVSPVAFWYWIQLRVNGDQPKKNQAQLCDAEARRHFFIQMMNNVRFDDLPLFLLWHGLRPQWGELLNLRQVRSGWSEQTLQDFITRQVTTPPLWLRVQKNALASEVCASLQQQGVDALLNAEGLMACGGVGINTTDAYKKGLVEIQDLASQQIAATVAAKPGQKIWDACAGAGGKTLAIAVQMNNKGAVFATDLHGYKLDELKRRAKRADVFNVRVFTWDGTEPLRLPKEAAQQQGFDWVLIDAPCSSAGTWRRNPDARWRFDPADTQELVNLQRQLLVNAAPAVRTGARLVYATCSWQVSENEQQVEWFLAQHPEFVLESQAILGAPEIDSDTMCVAVLVKK